ncbi:MAG TPA: hypothetical protein EYP03_00720, partial [Aquificae bacterium]|nr:hypothetical protein [Aquificota bacterium]
KMKIEGFNINSVYFNEKNNKIKNEKKKNSQNVEKDYKVEISLNYQLEDKDYQIKLEKITKAIKNGNYAIDLDKLAKSLIKEVLGE